MSFDSEPELSLADHLLIAYILSENYIPSEYKQLFDRLHKRVNWLQLENLKLRSDNEQLQHKPKRKPGRPKTTKLTDEFFKKFEEVAPQKRAEWGVKNDTAVIRRIVENRKYNGAKYKFDRENKEFISSFQVALSKYRKKRKALKKND
ncbi:hypothetical protein [Methylomonas koyamae]|uniref:Uncharacterized protein n=1 Tax=Methylomonas koyamae TaxID=702114 RepID=A0AA91I3G8_9GAMM|nr:hypothetical protein [Methylomonas koyamae]OAI22060.1 hypothetical protein A1356_19340 [Methylomonas koyamae]